MSDKRKTKAELIQDLSELRDEVSRLKEVEAGLERTAKEQLSRQGQTLEAINRVFREALTCDTEAQLCRTCLEVARELSLSPVGWLGDLDREGRLVETTTVALSPTLDGESGDDLQPLSGRPEVQGLVGRVLWDGRALYDNEPGAGEEGGTGEKRLSCVLGVPLRHGDQTVGMIGLADKEGGYDESDRATVESLAVAVVEVMMRKRAELLVREANQEMERRIDERTAELVSTNKALQKEIVERRRAVSALIASERKYRILVERSLQGTVIVQGMPPRIVFANPALAQILGYTVQELLDMSPEQSRSLVHSEDQGPFFRGYLARRANRAAARQFTFRVIHKDGSSRWVEVRASPIEFSGAPAVQANFVDISDRRQAEEELKRHQEHLEGLVEERTAELEAASESLRQEVAERKRAQEVLTRKARELERSNAELEQFAYVASHDLQEPLRMVTSFLQLLQERCEEALDETAREFIEHAKEGASRMQALIRDLLRFSRVGTRNHPLEPTDCERALITSLAHLVTAIEESEAEVTYDGLPTVMGDQRQLVQLFQNTVGNALKFRGERPPRVHIGAEERGESWVISVRDNGIGIDPQYQKRIFGIFERLHGRHDYPGTGIGLAICTRIIERHGGEIWVESEPGEGSTFNFTLPTVRAKMHQSAPEVLSSPDGPA